MTRYALPVALALMLAQPALACGTEGHAGAACPPQGCATTTSVSSERVAPVVPAKAVVVGVDTKTVAISGMVCAGCASKLSKTLTANPAVTAANVDYEKGEATITFLKGKITEAELTTLIEKAGFKADKVQPQT